MTAYPDSKCEAHKDIETGEPVCIVCLHAEAGRLRDLIDCACNALTDSILCSGNDAGTNLHFVRKLRREGLPINPAPEVKVIR